MLAAPLRGDLAVRVVAGQAAQAAVALDVTPALAQPVGVVVDLETLRPLLLVAVVDVNQVVRQRLARAVREVVAPEAVPPLLSSSPVDNSPSPPYRESTLR